MNDMPVILTAREAAAMLKVHPRTIREWAAAGRIRPARSTPGRHGTFLFSMEEVVRVAALPRPRRGRPPRKQTASAA